MCNIKRGDKRRKIKQKFMCCRVAVLNTKGLVSSLRDTERPEIKLESFETKI